MIIGDIMILLRKDDGFTPETRKAQIKYRMDAIEKLFELAELFFLCSFRVFVIDVCFPQYNYMMD